MATVDDAVRVLHVDDEAAFVDLSAELLPDFEESLAVATETDPEVALDRLEREPFDCVVADYEMPRMDGLDLLSAVREDRPDLPFILFTGKGSEEIASEAITAGVTDYLRKAGGTDRYEILANRVTNAVERRRAERERARGHRAMDLAFDGIALLDEDGEITYANDAYAETFVTEPGALVGTHWSRLYPDDEEYLVDAEILPAVRETGTWTGQTELRRTDGETFVGRHVVGGLDDGTAVCVVRGETAREELEAELRHERERFRLLVEEVEEYAIFTLDPDGRVASWNRGAERIEGYTDEEILGEHVSTFYTDTAVDDGVPERLLETAAAEGRVTHQGERVRKDGSTFWADVTITALREDGELRGFAKVTRDVTDRIERERREREAEQYRKRLYEITTDPERDAEQKVRDLLALGVERLDVDHGHVVDVDPETGRHEVVAASDEHPAVAVGEVTDLSGTFCRRTVTEDRLLGIHDVTERGWADDPAHEAFGFGCYLGGKLHADGDLFGTVCFVDEEPREEPFDHREKVFVELLSRWLSHELDRDGGALDQVAAS